MYEEGLNTLAELVVYRLEEGTWRTWPAASGPMMHAWPEHGFSRFSAAIERGALVLQHYSGGYTNVGFMHRFRWQNDRFELIGATSSVYERCDGGRELDYNLSTGKYIYREYTTDCKSDLEDPHATVKSVTGRAIRKTPLLLKSFGEWENKVVMPDGNSMAF